MAKKNDKYTNLIEQIGNILDFCKKVDEINPDHEMYLDGRDIYAGHVEHVLTEIQELIADIEAGKKPTYTKEWVEKTLKEAEDNYC